MSKNKKSKKQKREQRIAKGKQWILAYDGKKVVKGYCERFGVDAICAIKELKEIGYNFKSEDLEKIKQNEEQRLKQKAIEREKRLSKKQLQLEEDMYSDSDDTFFYIAGYTSGGAPYGVTWEQMGLEPYEKYET